MFKPLFRLAALRSAPGILIISYHRVLARNDPLFPELPCATLFEQQISVLSRAYPIVRLDAAVDRLRAGALTGPVAAITFDDGYRDNFEVALPILRRLGVSATFFVATAYLNGGCMFSDRIIEAVRNSKLDCADLKPLGLPTVSLRSGLERSHAMRGLCERVKYLPPEQREATVERVAQILGSQTRPALMMSSEQVRELHAAGMSIGSHTHRHVILSTVDAAAARQEIDQAQHELSSITGERPSLFAYPNGIPGTDFDPSHFAMLQAAGIKAAVSSRAGFATASSGSYELPRFSPWDRSPMRFRARLISNMLSKQPFGMAQLSSETI